jgi:hypothetical protein
MVIDTGGASFLWQGRWQRNADEEHVRKALRCPGASDEGGCFVKVPESADDDEAIGTIVGTRC